MKSEGGKVYLGCFGSGAGDNRYEKVAILALVGAESENYTLLLRLAAEQ